jgi:hypothetical protein
VRATKKLGVLAAAALVMGAAVSLAGCSTADPVVAARADAALGSLKLVRAEADLGTRARMNPETAALLGVPVIGERQADFTRETFDWLEAHLRALRARGLGQPGTVPMPAGPTAALLGEGGGAR